VSRDQVDGCADATCVESQNIFVITIIIFVIIRQARKMRAVDLRLRKLLELRTETPAMLSALEAVADVHSNKPPSGERARRELRSDIEHRNLDVVREFIESLRPFEQEVHALEGAVSELKSICKQAEARIDASQKDTAEVFEAGRGVVRPRRTSRRELERTTTFLRQYELDPAEAEALEGGPAGRRR